VGPLPSSKASPNSAGRVRQTGRLRRRCPHRSVSRQPVGADGNCLNIGGRARNLVCSNGTRATHCASDRAEEVALHAVRGHSNTRGVLIADQHARLDCVHDGLALVARFERCAGDVLAAFHRVYRTARVSVVAVVVCWTKGLSWRSRRGRGRRRSSGTSTVRWRRVVRGC
jgi:hypothetical protein